jgi:hypothetical protein
MIELISNQDMFYVNRNESITVKFTTINDLKLDDEQKLSIRCKLGSETLLTTMLSNDQFICSFISNTSKEVSVTLVYQNKDAYNGEILLSANSIPITVIGNLYLFNNLEKINISSILPFSTLKSVQMVTLNSSISLNYDSYYKCSFGGQTSNAQLTGKQFLCNLTKSGSLAYFTNVTLLIVSKVKETTLILSDNSLEFYFLSKRSYLIFRSTSNRFCCSSSRKILNISKEPFKQR